MQREKLRGASIWDSGRKAANGWRRLSLALLPAMLFPCACSPELYRSRADREAYTVLFDRTDEVENVEPVNLSLEPAGPIDLQGLPNRASGVDFLG